MLKGSRENECPYYEFDVPQKLDKLLGKRLIELPESKHLKETRRTSDPKSCKYHRIISHPIEKCRAFKEQVMQLAKEGKITLGREDTEESG